MVTAKSCVVIFVLLIIGFECAVIKIDNTSDDVDVEIIIKPKSKIVKEINVTPKNMSKEEKLNENRGKDIASFINNFVNDLPDNLFEDESNKDGGNTRNGERNEGIPSFKSRSGIVSGICPYGYKRISTFCWPLNQ